MNYTDLMKFFGCEPLEGHFPTFRELRDNKFKQITTLRGVYFVIDDTQPKEPILYIGMASASLRSRVRALVNKKENHKGGSDIWKLPHYEDLRICWKVNKCARDYEAEFIERYKHINEKRPFANKKA
jgi:molybdopterin synthase catalytic subunit